MIKAHVRFGNTPQDVMLDLADFLTENHGRCEYLCSSVYPSGEEDGDFVGQLYYWVEEK